jgi:mono/diheme cytochrome c family protein
MNISKHIIVVCLTVFVMVACNNGSPKNEEAKKSVQAPEKVENTSPDYVAGKQLFAKTCLPCHQKDGMGVPGMNPPLARTTYVLGDKKKLVGIILNGLSGSVEINGETYSNSMGSFAMLKDKEIALILSYVRQSFGNDADAVAPEEVANVRAAKKGN